MPRFFTVEEANTLLPQLRPLLSDLQELRRQRETVQEELDSLTPPESSNGHARDPRAIRVKSREVAQLDRRFERALRAVRSLGCEIKDVERGLIDFPALREGREIYLCWIPGEPEVGWWHDVEAGFQGRQRL